MDVPSAGSPDLTESDASVVRRRELRRQKLLSGRDKRLNYILGKADDPNLKPDEKPATGKYLFCVVHIDSHC